VSGGGEVLMTAYSAKEDEHAQWFDTPLPGRLNDVLGLKTNAFYDAASLHFDLAGKTVETDVHRYEVLEPSTATVLARFTNTSDHSPAITINKFGRGNALYLATESNPSAMTPVLDYLYKLTGIRLGPKTPQGVYARIVDGWTLYVNTTNQEKRLPIVGSKNGIITHRVFDGTVILQPQEADLVQ
jgi:beta-galactosidase